MMNVSTERLNHTGWAVLSTGSFYRGRGPTDCKGFSGVQPFALANVALQQMPALAPDSSDLLIEIPQGLGSPSCFVAES